MSKELAVVSDKNLANFTVFNMDQDTLAELRAEMSMGGNDELSRFDMPKITMPSAGLLQFIMPDGSTQKEIRGIICAFKDVRVFYRDNKTLGTPPDCVSEDCRVGRGKVRPDQERAGTFECAKCPHNEWGSAQNGGGGKACAERRILAIQTETGLLPMLLNLPVGSVRSIVTSMRGIISTHQALINNFLVTIKLKEEMNKSGTKYAVAYIDPDSVTRLDPEASDTLKSMRVAAKGMLEAIPKADIAEEEIIYDETQIKGFDETIDC